MTAKTSVYSVRMEMISGMQIPLPPFSEQRTIAEALSDADALVASLDALIAKKRAMKAGAMEELLSGRKRLPGFHGSRAEKKFSKLFDFFGGFSATREQLSDEGFCYLHYGDIHKSSQTYIDTKENFVAIPKLAVSLKRIASESLLHEGDVVFVDASEDAAGTSKHWVVSNEEDIPFISGLHTIIARSKKDDLDNKFKRYCFQCEKIKAQFQSYAVGTKVLGINKTSIGEIVLSYSTDLPEQRAIAALLSDMDAEIAALEARRDKAKLIKEGMMEALLTGRIRLVDAEATTSTIRKKKVTPADGQPRGHSRNFNDAVLIAVLTRRFGDLEHPLGHVRCQKMAYLFYRHTEKVATGFLKKAAGPYNPSTKYGGAEAIAKRRGYIVDRASGPLKGFGVGENNDEAFGYFERWYGEDALAWLERLHYEKKETLELWATVDMAMQELAEAKEEVSVEAVKGIIQSDPEWLPKLDRVIFSDENIAKAIAKSRELFG